MLQAVNGAFTRPLLGLGVKKSIHSILETRVLLRKNFLFSFQTTLVGDEWPGEVPCFPPNTYS